MAKPPPAATTLPAPPAVGPPAGGLPATPGLLYGFLAACMIGIGVAIYLVRHKLHITLDDTYISSCNLGGAINCDKVNVSKASEMFGLPISLFAIPTYAVMAYLGVVALRAIDTTDRAAREAGALALNAAAAIGVLTCAYSLFLAYYSTVEVEAYCLYCILLYAVNLAATGLAIAAGPKTVGNAVGGAFQGLAGFKDPIVTAIGVTVIAGGVAWFGYDTVKVGMEDARKAKIDEALGIKPGAAAADPAAGPSTAGAVVAEAKRPAPVAPGECPADTRKVESGGKIVCIGGKKTAEDGWTFVQFQLDDEDYVYGPADAKVTVVKVADFECAYCKYLAMTMEPLKTKYKDKVRFVMKHFPMNPACNRYMAGYDKHPNACNAHVTGVCAGRQGKFWEMHDKLYANQPKLDPEANRVAAGELGMDLAKYDACVKDPSTMARLKADIELSYAAGIYGTPKTYINGRLVTGSASTSILDYMIQKSLENPDVGAPGTEVKLAAKPDGTQMIEAKTAAKSFWIDPYEASLTADGKAVPKPGVAPAQASWTEADAACTKAGKRLCSEEEWVSACTGTPAVDENNNGQFADDNVEGKMYPYGDFYEAGNCADQEDKYKGAAANTGSKDKCRSPSGIFDMPGNIGEWSGTKDKAGLMGGHASSGERAACNQRSASFGTGNRNMTTGFRCCADQNVKTDVNIDVKATGEDLVGKPVPAFKAKDTSGADIDTAAFKGKVTLINFFASWCGPCKKEMPELVNLVKAHGTKGFQVVSIGVDREDGKSLEFAKGFGVNFSVVSDPESELMGLFNVYSMPATFIVDKQGVIRFKDTGFKPEEQLEKLRSAVQGLL